MLFPSGPSLFILLEKPQRPCSKIARLLYSTPEFLLRDFRSVTIIGIYGVKYGFLIMVTFLKFLNKNLSQVLPERQMELVSITL